MRDPGREREPDVIGWLLFLLITLLCALAAHIQCTGVRRSPLPGEG